MKKRTVPQANATIGRLIELKVQLEAMKPLYQQYDRCLEVALRTGSIPAQVQHKGNTWIIAVTDTFQEKNTAWKSVAQRRFDVAISKKKTGLFKVR
jgi:hypothetical protein